MSTWKDLIEVYVQFRQAPPQKVRLPCPALPCPALPCPALSCPALVLHLTLQRHRFAQDCVQTATWIQHRQILLWISKIFHVSAAIYLRPSLFWNVIRRTLVFSDVSGQNIGPIFKGQAVQEEWTAMVRHKHSKKNYSSWIARPLTVWRWARNYQPTTYNTAEDWRSQDIKSCNSRFVCNGQRNLAARKFNHEHSYTRAC